MYAMLATKAGPRKGRICRKKPRRLLPERISDAAAAVFSDIVEAFGFRAPTRLDHDLL